MIFYDNDGKRLLQPLIISWERILEINQVPVLTIITAGTKINKNDRVVFFDEDEKPHEFIVVEPTEIKEDGCIRHLYCHGSESTLAGKFIADFRPTGSAISALATMLQSTEFTAGTSDNLGTSRNMYYRSSALESLSKLLENFKAEYETEYELGATGITSRKINLKKQIGKDLGKRCSYNKDLTRIERKVLSTPIVTKYYPFGRGEQIGDGYGRRIDISSVNDGKPYLEDEARRLSDGIGKNRLHYEAYEIYESIEDPAELLAEATERFAQLSQHQVTYSGNLLDLAAMGFPHENVRLGDWVTIQDEDMGSELKPYDHPDGSIEDGLDLLVKARVVKLVESKWLKDITLGNYVPFFEKDQKDMHDAIKSLMSRAGGWDIAAMSIDDGSFLDNILDEVNAGLNTVGGWAQLIPGRGLIVPNAQDEDEATWIVEVGGGYIRFANSRKSDGTWDYRNISDANGVIADVITTGILRGGLVQFNLEAGTFLIGENIDNHKLYFDGENLHMNGQFVDLSLNEQFNLKISKDDLLDDPTLQQMIISNTEPEEPNERQLWLDTSTHPNVIKRWDGAEWEIVSDIQQIQDALDGKVSHESLADELQNIVAGITASYQSEFEQTATDINFRFTEVIDAINAEGGRITSLSNEIETNIRFTSTGIEMGKTTSPISIQIMHNKIAFVESGREVAYFSNNTLYVTDVNVTGKFTFHDFGFTRESNGSITWGKVT